MYFPNPFKFKGMHPPGKPPFRPGFRPDLAFWAGVLALILAISGWRRQVVVAHFLRVRSAFLRRFPAKEAQALTAWSLFSSRFGGLKPYLFYAYLINRAARDLMGFFTVTYPHPLRLAPGSTPVLEAMRQGPCLFLTAHFHHFEALGSYLVSQGIPLRAIARPMSRPWAQNWLIRLRERIGLPVIWSARPGRVRKAESDTLTAQFGSASQQDPSLAAQVGHSSRAAQPENGLWMREAIRHVQAEGCLAMLWDQRPRRPAGIQARFFDGIVECDALPRFVLEAMSRSRPDFVVPIYVGFLQPSGEVRLAVLRSGGHSRNQQPEKENRGEVSATRVEGFNAVAQRYHRWLEGVTLRFPCHAYWMLHRRFG